MTKITAAKSRELQRQSLKPAAIAALDNQIPLPVACIRGTAWHDKRYHFVTK